MRAIRGLSGWTRPVHSEKAALAVERSAPVRRASRVRRVLSSWAACAALACVATVAVTSTAAAAPPPPPPPAPSPVAGVSGSSAHPQQPPSFMDEGVELWEGIGWPNWRNIGNQEWFTAGSFVDPATRQRVNEIVYTGGRYQDRDGRLRAFLDQGNAGSSSVGYTGTFQEYNTTVYHRQVNDAIPRRDAARVVRAIGTGDLFWTDDHYSTFHYMGRH